MAFHRWFTHRTHLSRVTIALVSVCPVEYSHIKGVRCAFLAADRLERAGPGAVRGHPFDLGQRATRRPTRVNDGVPALIRLHVEMPATRGRLARLDPPFFTTFASAEGRGPSVPRQFPAAHRRRQPQSPRPPPSEEMLAA